VALTELDPIDDHLIDTMHTLALRTPFPVHRFLTRDNQKPKRERGVAHSQPVTTPTQSAET
jgi:hypothetical protein